MHPSTGRLTPRAGRRCGRCAGSRAGSRGPSRGELGVGQPLRPGQQQADRVVDQRVAQLVDRRGGRAVDRHAAQPEAGGRLDLVAHEREQRRQRRPEPVAAQQMSGEEVDHALAPLPALHDQHPRLIADERLYRLPLPVPELRTDPTGERPQRLGELGGFRQTASMPAGCHGRSRTAIASSPDTTRGRSPRSPRPEPTAGGRPREFEKVGCPHRRSRSSQCRSCSRASRDEANATKPPVRHAMAAASTQASAASAALIDDRWRGPIGTGRSSGSRSPAPARPLRAPHR